MNSMIKANSFEEKSIGIILMKIQNKKNENKREYKIALILAQIFEANITNLLFMSSTNSGF